MPSLSENNLSYDHFGESTSEAFFLYMQIRNLGKKMLAQEILSDNQLTPQEKVERLRDLIKSLEM